ncbi:hypothetical protein U9M48_035717 [Paspalum notatum var. saurae]|uniref:Uncharacterized protein n=1 Tax=Paspalum notatum var. saurae TaxID=547442 RepID=A0AAQ3UBL0_PASNO
MRTSPKTRTRLPITPLRKHPLTRAEKVWSF